MYSLCDTRRIDGGIWDGMATERIGEDMDFETKDSGKREEFKTGMVRDTQDDKPRYDLIDRPFLKRWAELMARGAKKYGEENWRKAATEEELKRFKASAIRHHMQYMEGDTTEDHAAAVAFNLAGAEMVREKLKLRDIKKKCCGDCLTDEPCVCDKDCLL